MEYKIVHLAKEKWKGHIIPIKYITKQYYDVVVDKKENGFSVNVEKKDFVEVVTHTPEECDFQDKLYE